MQKLPLWTMFSNNYLQIFLNSTVMRVILNIARAELRYFFYSPVAWFILILFLMSGSGIVLGNLVNMVTQQESLIELQGDKFEGFMNSPLTTAIIGSSLGTVMTIFFTFIPLLTMGVINREYAGGTIRLLHSSPVRMRQVVIGKFIGVYAFVCMMILLLAVILFVLTFSVKNVETPHILSMLLGFFLLAAMYVAVGVFISSLTAYPIVAAIGTFTVLTLFTAFGGIFQGYDYIRDITYFLSSSGRAEVMLGGLITTKDLIYFFSIISLFLIFTIIKMKSVTESKSWRISAGRYLMALAVTVVILTVTSIHGFIGYWDVTRSKLNTLHPNTQAVINKLDGSPLKVTLYTNLLGYNYSNGAPEARNAYLWGFWSKYRRFYNNMEFNYVYYYDVDNGDSSIYKMYPGKTLKEIAEKYAEIYNTDLSIYKKPEEISSIIDLRSETKGLLMQVEYKGKKTFLRTYQDPSVFPNEMHVSGSLLRLMNDTTPTYKFLTGHYERSPMKFGEREYGGHTVNKGSRGALINMGLNFDTISEPDFSGFTQDEVLVISDPKTLLDKAIIDSVNKYIDGGGNAMFYTEPGKQFIMNPILNHVGVNADPGTMVKVNPHDMPHKFGGLITKKGTEMADEGKFFLFRNGIIKACYTAITGASPLSYSDSTGFKTEPITTLKNEKNTWVERGVLVVDSAAPLFNASEGDYRLDTPYPVGLQLTRKINNKEQKIIISSDADMMSFGKGNGMDYGNAFYSYTVDNRYPVYHNFKVPTDIWLTIKKVPAQTLKTLLQYGLPALLLVAGIVILVRRKRK
ncbi:ABC-2 type transport system permease protein [Pseudobacter ginsenosidimutans]|uniref:ABC-2 type transport system permease protein n=2 Tax=Pseudobacter ginsenosidimutans TaxID=661488 RepID=A0A4Q7MRG9_9BACT|nr:Gldg family protein [Pseudobacter ginsenosidimutans]QEC42141.1 ABC transporter permease subunit [Pseudobacter ginsenosidimutans]RZS71018.1 ABC-2 type transport system permease protein [Pseudobacter ginsenosidimutans]